MRNCGIVAALAGAIWLASVTPGMAAGSVMVERAWSRATAGASDVGVVFVTIRNLGGTDDALVAAASPVAGSVQLHAESISGGIMTMEALDSARIPAHGALTLKPGGDHLMLMGLKRLLIKGQRFPLTLTFAKAGAVLAEVAVGSAGARAAP